MTIRKEESESRTTHLANHNIFLELNKGYIVAHGVGVHQEVRRNVEPEKMLVNGQD
jgi:hypothetical protein